MKDRGRPLTDSEEAFLRQHYASDGYAWCAEQMGRSVNSVKRWATILGVTTIKRPPWRPEESELLKKYLPTYGVKWCAKKLGRSISVTQKWAIALDLQNSRTARRQMLAPVIEEMYMQGIPNNIIADVLQCSPRYVASRVSGVGLAEIRQMQQEDQAQDIAIKHGFEL